MSTEQQGNGWLIGVDVRMANGAVARQLFPCTTDPQKQFEQTVQTTHEADRGEFLRVTLYQPSEVPTPGWVEFAHHVLEGEDQAVPPTEEEGPMRDPELAHPHSHAPAAAFLWSASQMLTGMANMAGAVAEAASAHG